MRRRTWLGSALMALVITVGDADPAQAQLGWSFVGVGEFDSEDVIFVLGGVSVSAGGSGWVPVAGVSASWLQYPSGLTDENRTITSITPSAGLANRFSGGSFQVRVGYAFRNADGDDDDDIPVPPVSAADVAGDGVVGYTQLDWWGTGPLNAQAIASYNFGSESLWTRGRLTHRLFGLGDDGHLRAGVEAAYLNSRFYDGTQIGGVVGIHPGAGTIINLGIGRKLSDDSKDATYFRAELVLVPAR